MGNTELHLAARTTARRECWSRLRGQRAEQGQRDGAEDGGATEDEKQDDGGGGEGEGRRTMRLADAVECDDAGLVEESLQAGADVNAQDLKL